MGPLRVALAVTLAVGLSVVALSGGEGADPRTPATLPGMPATFLGVAIVGSGPRTAAGGRRVGAAEADRWWLARAAPLGPAGLGWAGEMCERSRLVLGAVTVGGGGAVAAGDGDGWAYVGPGDAGAVALALTAAGY